MPDPGVYCDYLTETFEDLKKAAKQPKTRRAKTNGSGRVPDGKSATNKKTTRKRVSKSREVREPVCMA
jgi:hypothetical protein